MKGGGEERVTEKKVCFILMHNKQAVALNWVEQINNLQASELIISKRRIGKVGLGGRGFLTDCESRRLEPHQATCDSPPLTNFFSHSPDLLFTKKKTTLIYC